jgi:hypothetical protein
MDIFIEQCIDYKNMIIIVNKENEKNKENKLIKVVFQLGPEKKNEYKLYKFKRWEL